MLKQILKGIATYIPGLYTLYSKGTGGSNSARYCYSVWLRHLVLAEQNGLCTNRNVFAELGPGDSIGIGLAALLSGYTKYYAFDVVEYANKERNISIFNEIVELFSKREPIPDEQEFPRVLPHLESYNFPKHILSDLLLDEMLNKTRIELIMNAILNMNNKRKTSDDEIEISYVAPWNDPNIVNPNSIDLLLTQSVMELVDDLENTYETLNKWLTPSGFMSHTIAFNSLHTSGEWNGHWTYSDPVWKLIRGNRPWSINREPHSAHIKLMEKLGFDIVCDSIIKRDSNIKKSELAKRFRNLSDDDLTTGATNIQAVKR